jgi:serine/threonine protein kinase
VPRLTPELARLVRSLENAENHRYSVDKPIGEGGHAYTLLATDSRRNGGLVAIKIAKADVRGDKVNLDTDLVEEGMRAALLCPHDNIVQIYGFVRYEQTKRGLVMEYVKGGSLRLTMPELLGDTLRCVSIVAGVCRALLKAHEYPMPLVHRDVKPENILMDKATPKLTDYGIATELSTLPVDLLGSLPYMAPEYLVGKNHSADPRSDLYSLIVVLFEMLHGHPPFHAENTTAVIHRIKHDPLPDLRPDLPSALRRIICKGLQKEPAARYQSARDLLFELELFLKFYAEVLVPLEKFEDGLGAERPQSDQRTKTFLYLGERYLELATETLSGVFGDMSPGLQRSQLELRLKLLSAAGSEDTRTGTAALGSLGPGPADSVPPQSGGGPPRALEAEEDIAEIKGFLQQQSIEAAIARSQTLFGLERSDLVFQEVADLFYQWSIFDQSVALCKTGLEQHPDHAGLLAIQGKSLLECGSREAGRQSLKRAVQLGSKDPEALALYNDLFQERLPS